MATLADINADFPSDIYSVHNLFFTDRFVPEFILDYVSEYMALPISELRAHGFSQHPGSPVFVKGKRLVETVNRFIRFSSNECSLYRVLIQELDVRIFSRAESWKLYVDLLLIHQQVTKVSTAAFENDVAKQKVKKLVLEYEDILDELAKKVFGPSFVSNYTSSQFWDEYERLRNTKHELANEVDELSVVPKKEIAFSDTNQVGPFRTYLRHCMTEDRQQFVMYCGRIFSQFKTKQIAVIKSHLEALIYSCILNEMVARCKREKNVADKAFLVTESIRTFRGPLNRFSNPETHLDRTLIYEHMDLEEAMFILSPDVIKEQEEFDEDAWNRWFDNATQTRVPLSETRRWKQLLVMGREQYGRDDLFEAMQEEYDDEQEDLRTRNITPLLVEGETLSGSLVTIYGEMHNRINNRPYEAEQFNTRNDITVWVEHDTVFCDLQAYEEAMFTKKKGLEWVWFQRVKRGLPVTCIDIRNSLGLPIALEEDAFREQCGIPILFSDPKFTALRSAMIHKNKIAEASGIIDYINVLLTKYMSLADLMKPIKTTFDAFISVMRAQLETITDMVTKDLPPVEISIKDQFEDEIISSTTFAEELMHLGRNMLKVHSLVVDAHLMNLIHSYNEDKPIFLFVGLNHAFRLANLLDWEIIENRTVDGSLESVAMESLKPTMLRREEYTMIDKEGRKRKSKHRKRGKKHSVTK